jgi:hypothetical protein
MLGEKTRVTEVMERFARLRLFGKSPFKAYLRMHDSVWTRILPPGA